MDKKRGACFSRIYAVVARIPCGRVMTYGQVAALAGSLCTGRVVGFAMSRAPAALNLPCHRVVNRQGDMAPGSVFDGADRQRRLLRREGVRFLRDGRVDFARSGTGVEVNLGVEDLRGDGRSAKKERALGPGNSLRRPRKAGKPSGAHQSRLTY